MNRAQILKELARIDFVVARPKDPGGLTIAAEVFTDLCGHLTPAEFRSAADSYLRVSEFWPTPAAILRNHAANMEENRRQIALQLPEPEIISDEQRAINLTAIKDLRAKLKLKRL